MSTDSVSELRSIKAVKHKQLGDCGNKGIFYNTVL